MFNVIIQLKANCLYIAYARAFNVAVKVPLFAMQIVFVQFICTFLGWGRRGGGGWAVRGWGGGGVGRGGVLLKMPYVGGEHGQTESK